jgi:hypothetical protein
MYGCQLEASITERFAADAADASDAAFALFGSLMPSMGAAEPLQLGEVPAADADGVISSDVAQPASAADAKPAAVAGGWRQRKQVPGDRRRVSR